MIPHELQHPSLVHRTRVGHERPRTVAGQDADSVEPFGLQLPGDHRRFATYGPAVQTVHPWLHSELVQEQQRRDWQRLLSFYVLSSLLARIDLQKTQHARLISRHISFEHNND